MSDLKDPWDAADDELMRRVQRWDAGAEERRERFLGELDVEGYVPRGLNEIERLHRIEDRARQILEPTELYKRFADPFEMARWILEGDRVG